MLTDTEQTSKTARKGKINTKPQVNASSVRAYLKANTGFFAKPANKKLLESMKVPHYSGCSISLLECQVQLFRQQRDDLSNQLESIIEIHKTNQRILTVFVNLVQDMIECETLTNLVDVFSCCWRESLDVDAVSLMFADTGLYQSLNLAEHKIEKEIKLIDANKQKLPRAIGVAAKTKKVLCQQINKENQKLFSKKLSSGSFVFVPAGKDDQACYVFLGSKNSEKFSPEMQPDMVSFVCHVFSSLFYSQHRLITEKQGS